MGPGQNNGGGGGGTGIYGQGPNGTAGSVGGPTATDPGIAGGGGSGGGSGSDSFSGEGSVTYPSPTSPYSQSGGQFGGGGGNYYKGGGPGVVRIVWGNAVRDREFPTTDVGPSPEE